MKFPPFPLFYDQPIKKIDFFHYPRVSTGALPLTKKPVDSGYEIGLKEMRAKMSCSVPVFACIQDVNRVISILNDAPSPGEQDVKESNGEPGFLR